MERTEAIEVIRENRPDASFSQLREALETLIPELKESEESEEEKRVKAIEVLEQQRYFWSYDGPADKTPPATKRKDLVEAIDVALSYLEKQKENPKSCDSIPSDCASDAKCEDRWHKVTDSLPDNPREVLRKDEAGNYFIGRYYVGEGWDISNYDDEDKPHHLNPPVSKWIDFPSEKQKEQKPWKVGANAYFTPEQKPAEINVKALLAADRLASAEMTGRLKERSEILENPEKYGLQKTAEWSEEDELMQTTVIQTLERFGGCGTTGMQIDWLKSLRPSWRPSKDEECKNSK